ncbi:MAG: hypothetical protein MJ067_04355 [Oscillospiraceae bacterium]|nr:hypothetical protein [Oscillospiraceae bacterium]
MTFEDYIKFLANCFSENTVPDIVPYLSDDAVYISRGKNVASGREEIEATLKRKQTATAVDSVINHGYAAVVNKTGNPNVKIGDKVVALVQFDKYNCTGYMRIETNSLAQINKLDFCVDSETECTCETDDRFSVNHVPLDAHDAIVYRALALGIMDTNVILSKHVQRYDIFRYMAQTVCDYIYAYVIKDFNKRITDIAGYMYATAMITAVGRERENISVKSFSPVDAANGLIPEVDERYQGWINDGYEMGKKLFLGFTEYFYLRHPDNEELEKQMLQSYMDICLFGSIQANRDMDMGRPF